MSEAPLYLITEQGFYMSPTLSDWLFKLPVSWSARGTLMVIISKGPGFVATAQNMANKAETPAQMKRHLKELRNIEALNEDGTVNQDKLPKIQSGGAQ